MISSNNRFAFEVYERLRKKEEGNLFFSPYSIAEAMGMVFAGARGETAGEIAQVLHFDQPQVELHRAFQSLRNTTAGTRNGADYELTVANRLWGQTGFPILGAYRDLTRTRYGAEMQAVDFSQPAAAESINSWVANQTNEKIRNFILPADLDPALIRLVLTNAIYFKGRWQEQFLKVNTRRQPFFIDEETVEVQMMYQTEKFRYADDDEKQILELPYRGGGLSMILILPEKKSREALTQLELVLNAQNLAEWLSHIKEQKVDLFIPKFRFESEFRVSESLRAMGIKQAFDPGSADFTGITSARPFWLQWVLHKAYVDVDEQGTEAAAATGGGFGGGFSPPMKIPVFRADHPFLFLIRDNRTKNILFLGRVVNPREG